MYDHQPTFSPDGARIVFVSGDGSSGSYDIYVMDADGGNKTRLTNNSVHEQEPSWSPHGSKIVFERHTGESDLYTMNADGTNQTNLTNTATVGEQEPAWAPDGSQIAFSRAEPSMKMGIYTIQPDGSKLRPITSEPVNSHFSPAWSPDGSQIAFVKQTAGKVQDENGQYVDDGTYNNDIYVMDADGANMTNLTNTPHWQSMGEFAPEWSPDGTRIAFSDYRGPNSSYDVYAMNADGSAQTQLTPQDTGADPVYQSRPSWQPLPSYVFSGFFSPVNDLPTLNSVKAGKSIPIRFGLGGDKGLSILAEGYPKSEPVACDSTAPVDGIEETVLGRHGLSYNAGTERYEYEWATKSAWTGCRQFMMKLKDGSVQRATFSFR